MRDYSTIELPIDLETIAGELSLSMKPPISDWLSEDELRQIGFKSVGKNVKVSRKCSFYGLNASIGSNCRIDDFCILKGNLEIGNYVHLASYCLVNGSHGQVRIEDFVGVAARMSLFTGSDDYSANTLGNPTTPVEYTTPVTGSVTIGFATMIGSHVVILPNVKIGAACSVGINVVVHKDLPEGTIIRSPKAIISDRKRDVKRVMELGKALLGSR